ncbi:ATP-binding cassette domain-containing protein [uncultured Microbacterium sp.]|uniref:ATP-binding cassette domain-containing protein n=1 Tax=uncultured Microbacterium sp. TaxID=191216 RepID=UPI00259ADE01|nr:ATP-binding cassette domain-containing protein [uncultured Microbacterium sp.]
MPEGHVLEFTDVTKRFGSVAAVDGLTARVEPGTVTGFLGPNGAGKTTSLRILLGLVTATSGTATIAGRRYADLTRPLQTVGAALEASSFHPGRTAANHLKVYAQAAGLPSSRVDEVLGLVGLADVAGRKVGGFSLGMRQRLSLAYTLLGDPGVLVLDEPANGLDPEGIKWLRGFLRELAREGRTVLVSSHMLAEVQQTVSSLLIISHGRLVYQGDMAGLTQESDYATVIDSPDRAALGAALDAAGIAYEPLRTGFTVRSADPAQLGALAASAGVALSNLQRKGPALEEVFLDLVNGVRVHASVGTVAADGAGGAPAVDAAVVDAEAVDATPDVAEQDAPATDAVAPAVAEPEPAPEAEPETQPEQPAEEADAFFARYTSETDAADAAGEAAAAGTSEEPPSADDPPSPAGEAAPPSEPGDAAEGGEQR